LKAAANPLRREKILSMNLVRAELYKLYYYDSLFDLNVKGDAAEFLTTLLKILHSCYIDYDVRT
jgi:hypothetical protein